MAKILVVDDEKELRSFLQIVLAASGYEVVTAEDGETGIALAASESPDVILMDVNMPGMTGYEAVRKLKADDATRGIPVLAVTAHNRPMDQEEAHEAGCEGLVAKPLDPGRVIERVQEVLGG